MDDREFKLEVLRVTLSNSTPATQANPLAEAQRNLEWCIKEFDKPVARNLKAPTRQTKGQA